MITQSAFIASVFVHAKESKNNCVSENSTFQSIKAIFWAG